MKNCWINSTSSGEDRGVLQGCRLVWNERAFYFSKAGKCMRIDQQKYCAPQATFLFCCLIVNPQLQCKDLKAQGGCGPINKFLFKECKGMKGKGISVPER